MTTAQTDTFEKLLNGLDGAEAHRTLFAKAWKASPQGFARVVADGHRYARAKALDFVHAAVLADEHLAKGRAAGDGPSGWVVHVESERGVTPHRFGTSADAASFVAGLEGVEWISDADQYTRELYVCLREKVASPVSTSRAPARERQAA